MTSNFESLYYQSPVWLQNVLVSAMGYKLFLKRYTGTYRDVRKLVEQARNWTHQETIDYQSEQLHEMVRFCRENVPYYQRVFSDIGLSEQHITHVSDLRKLPVLDKDTLRSRPEEFQVPGQKSFVLQNTSGSTGTPLTLAVNERTYKMAMALVVDHEEFHGVPFGARRATFAGRMVQRASDLTPPFSRFNRAENQRLYSSYHLNPATFPAYRKDLDVFAPKELIGYPSAIAELAGYYAATGTVPQFQPTVIITNSETLLAWQRERIESVFGCPVRDYYGTAEYVVFAGQDKHGLYQCNPTLGVTEVLPYSSGELAGDVIATTLTNTCMPLLRYRVGDSATLTAREDLMEASQTRLASINGRIDDYIETPDGRKIGRIDHIFKGLSGIREAQVVQDRPDHCTINIVRADDSSPVDEHTLEENFKARTGSQVGLTFQYSDAIPRSANGKFKSVVRL
jgi:phenylacetate-CoA ligase